MSQKHQLIEGSCSSNSNFQQKNLTKQNSTIDEVWQSQQSPIFPTIVIHEVEEEQSEIFETQEEKQPLGQNPSVFIEPQTEKMQDLPRDLPEKSEQKKKQSQEQAGLLRGKSISLEESNQNDVNFESNGFQVVVHSIQSRKSLAQKDDEQQYLANFTKSQLNIPINYTGPLEQKKQKTKQELQTVNQLYGQSQDEDFYVKFVEERWAKKQQSQIQKSEDSETVKLYELKDSFVQLTRSQQSSIQRDNSLNGQSQVQNKDSSKKTQFKVKKLYDHSNSSTKDARAIKTSNEPRNSDLFKNNSELLNKNLKEPKKSYKYNRGGKKHASNLESLADSEDKRYAKPQTSQNVQYEFSCNSSVEMMSHILEDKCYDSLNHKASQKSPPASQYQKDQSANKIRKIIKRSPYGILQIEVIDKKNAAKITNLRILKPKQMMRLKKIPNIAKSNKQNLTSKTGSKNSTQNGQFINQKQKFVIQSPLPTINASKR